MITPSKEGSKEKCGTRVEVNLNSDILQQLLNTDMNGCNDSVVYPRMFMCHVYRQPRRQCRPLDSEQESITIPVHVSYQVPLRLSVPSSE